MAAYRTPASHTESRSSADDDSNPQLPQLEQLTALDQRRLDSAVMMLVNYLVSASSKETESML